MVLEVDIYISRNCFLFFLRFFNFLIDFFGGFMQQVGSAPYSFEIFIAFGWVALFLLIGAGLRVKVPFFQRYLIPGCMIGGFAGFLFTNTGISAFLGSYSPDFRALETIIYHLYNLTYIALGFSGIGGGGKKRANTMVANTVRCSLASSGCNYLQQAVGIGIIFLLNFIIGTELLETAGILVAKGFGNGPGAAMAQGAAYEQAGFGGMVSLGLAFSAIGYVAAIIVGVPLANHIMRKRGIEGRGVRATNDELRGIYSADRAPEAGKLTFMGTNIDTMSFHLSLLLLSYACAFLTLNGIGTAGLISPQGMTMVWSLFAPLFCLPIGMILRRLVVGKLLQADHLYDNGAHNRVLNAMIDLTAVAALIGIQIHVITEWIPALITVSICTVCSTLVFYALATRSNAQYKEERLLALFGLSTGTVTSGLVLVRMIDPDYKSTVPFELSLMAIPSLLMLIPFLPVILPLGFAQVFGGKAWTVPFYASIAMFAFFTTCLIVYSYIIDKRERKALATEAATTE